MTSRRSEKTLTLADRKIHAYLWQDSTFEDAAPRSVAILFHGLMMHGGSFDHVADRLSGRGSLVVAPDLRGFGRWHYGANDERHGIDYRESLLDAQALLEHFSGLYPAAPRFCIGESLGAHLARRLVCARPELVSGLVLSSPCLRPRMISIPLIPHAFTELVSTSLSPGKQINLTPFARRFLSKEPDNLNTYLEDPLARKSLDVLELIDSVRIVGSITPQAIPERIPVLILRGKQDCVCKSSSIKRFVETLESDNITIHPCKGCGHLILQGAEVDGEIETVLCDWIEARIASK
ncbi:MAG: alpha/beta fold hydrolase [Candidatus Melainabacteria bacterium]|nr:alpha/beta fold hydrolase [Candidatus Melainabacteria bacterium]